MNDYLNDKIFLRELDEMSEKEQYISIIVLDQNEYELEEIQGYVTSGGTLSINGDSSVSRTCTLNMIADDKYTVIGSMNFSYSGENKNDENVLIIENFTSRFFLTVV